MDTSRVPQPRQDDTRRSQAHFASLERLCACLEGWVFITFEDEHGEEREASYLCRRCACSKAAREEG